MIGNETIQAVSSFTPLFDGINGMMAKIGYTLSLDQRVEGQSSIIIQDLAIRANGIDPGLSNETSSTLDSTSWLNGSSY